MERDGQFFIPRYIPENSMNDSLARGSQMDVAPRTASLVQACRPLKLTISQPGRLDTLQFIDDNSASEPLREDEVEVEVQACGLNFLDVMVAMGEIPRSSFGVEAAGIVRGVGVKVEDFVAGDRVLLMAPGVMRTVMRACPSSLHKIPAGMSLEDAVSIPVVYATAYHSLLELARLQEGESVLIHAAAGGLGQALIQIAKMLRAEIYCTVGSEAKKKAIIALGVKPDNIFSSRGLSFEKGIKRVTQGRGVDVIVNSLAGEALRRSWLCLAPYGRFVEVGKMDLMSNNGLEMRPFLTGTTFSGCNLEYMMLNDPLRVTALLSKVMRLFERGAVKLVRPITVHDFSDVELAFRELQRGAHIGKLILRVTAESRVPVLPPKSVDMKLKADGTYVLVGGLGGLGRGQALFMAKHGARHLGFISRSGGASKDAQAVMKSLAEQGLQAKVYAGDITDRTTLKAILDDISKSMPPIRGVIQGAMQLDDSIFHKMSYRQWMAATRPKVQGSWNLHELLPDTLDFFIMLSSLAGIIGSVSQANYAAGNTYQDALAHYRRSKGLPALSINLGIIRGLGYVAEHKDVAARLGQIGLASVNESQFFHLLQCAIAGTADNQSRLPDQLLTGAGTGGAMRAAEKAETEINLSWLDTQAAFSHLRRLGDETLKAERGGSQDGGKTKQLVGDLGCAKTMDQAAQTAQQILLERMARVISISVSDIDTSKPVYAYGVDSLVAVELRNWLAMELKSELSIFDLTSNAPISDVSLKIASRSLLVPADVKIGNGE
jgi:NADPH:quinone reductase-like Zn-dependent oxidoreductase/NAD(P)-dependent dehydrogenase (short-subunit alcohol dehydrogenase family)